MIQTSRVILALGLTLIAGLSTGIGGLLALFAKRTNEKIISVALGFSAGVMIYISFTELLSESKILLIGEGGRYIGSLITVFSFFGGILIMALIDKLIPEYQNPHEAHRIEEISDKKRTAKLYKCGICTALALAIHNFPEGIATFTSALTNLKLGVAITVAIAIHNIPEGIAVSVPMYFATGNKKKAFKYSLLSGIAEPLGAFLAYLILSNILTDSIQGVLFGTVAGIMVFIAFDELLPTAAEYGEHHLALYGLISGMLIMALSLILLG